MSVQVLRAAERLAVPWKNGGGVTRELAAAPAGAGMEAFDWRISIAEVAAGGPFSSFPGVDRVLTVIAGEGLSLAIDGRPAVVLGAASPPLAFSGEARCEAALRAGPIRDLNVMVRRGGWRAECGAGRCTPTRPSPAAPASPCSWRWSPSACPGRAGRPGSAPKTRS